MQKSCVALPLASRGGSAPKKVPRAQQSRQSYRQPRNKWKEPCNCLKKGCGQVIHMSSASPRGRTQGQPGEYVREYNKMDWILRPWGGKIHDIVSSLKKRGGGIQNFVIILDGKVHGNP